MARDVLLGSGMANETCCRHRTTVGLAVVIVALVGGSRAASADEADVSEERGTQQGETQQTPVAEEPAVSMDPQAPEERRASAQSQTFEQPVAPQRAGAERPRTSWYGWQTAGSDVGVIGLWIAAYLVDEAKSGATSWQTYDAAVNVLVWSGVAVYALGAPAIHLAHGNGRKALGSFGLRAGLPIAGAIAGALIGSVACGSDDNDFISCPVVFGVLGFVGGGIAAPIVDGTVLARETVTAPAEPRFQAAFVPSASGGTFVLGGRF
jgi:hypothetical protein